MPFSHAIALVAMTAFSGGALAHGDGGVRINQIQIIGTHNSYHSGFAPSAAKLWQQKNPKVFAGLDYRHPSLTSQLDAGVRQIEIDIFADTKGGLYAHPYGETLIAQAGLPSDPPFDPQHLMEKPGFKVMHVQDVDYRSACEPFTACLAEVRAWSKAHPNHLPVFILVETKQGALHVQFPTVTPENFTPSIFDALDREITSVFRAGEMITPDDVRGSYATLNQAVRADHAPSSAWQGRLFDGPEEDGARLPGGPSVAEGPHSVHQCRCGNRGCCVHRTERRIGGGDQGIGAARVSDPRAG
jgi:hypothetical protein